MTDDNPTNWLTPLQEGAAQVHELFLAYLNAGFNREEALQLTIAILTKN